MSYQNNPPRPIISVVMGVFNGADFVGRAIDSILSQTYENFEFIIVDDGSTDSTPALCKGYKDPRIRFIQNSKNCGLSTSLNLGIAAAQGQYIARMDADDISYPTRLAHQLKFMESNPDIGICGTWYEQDDGKRSKIIRPPTDDQTIRFMLTFDAVFAHASIFIRRALLVENKLRYEPSYMAAQDFDLWVRCLPHTRFANLPEVQLCYHIHPGNTSNRKHHEQIRVANIARQQILLELGLNPSNIESEIHNQLLLFKFQGDLLRLEAAGQWLNKLTHAVRENSNIDQSVILSELGRYWYGACGRLADHGPLAYKIFKSHPCAKHSRIIYHAKLIARCLAYRKIDYKS